MAGPFDAHQGAAQETESRFPSTPEDPPPDFRRKQMWVVFAIAAIAVLGWLIYVLVR